MTDAELAERIMQKTHGHRWAEYTETYTVVLGLIQRRTADLEQRLAASEAQAAQLCENLEPFFQAHGHPSAIPGPGQALLDRLHAAEAERDSLKADCTLLRVGVQELSERLCTMQSEITRLNAVGEQACASVVESRRSVQEASQRIRDLEAERERLRQALREGK